MTPGKVIAVRFGGSKPNIGGSGLPPVLLSPGHMNASGTKLNFLKPKITQ
jgi:hypothetical protein